MARRVHYVGSLPPELMTSDGDMMEWFAGRSSGHQLTALPCDLDPNWIIQYLHDRENHLENLEVIRDGDLTEYSKMRTYSVKRGHTLTPADVSMNRVERIREVIAAFREVQAAHPELAGAKLQISQPSPLDMALFVFAGAAVTDGMPLGRAIRHSGMVRTALRHLPTFVTAVVDEIATLTAEHPDTIVWQVETPVALVGMVKAAQFGARIPAGRMLARQLADFLAQLHHTGAETVVHLCYGNYNKKELLAPRTIAPAVDLIEPAGRLLRTRGVPFPPVHIPCAYGENAAPVDPAFYRPLRRLDSDWRLIAGVVSETSIEGSIHSLGQFEQASGRTAYAVATTCGLGRYTVDDAVQAATAMTATAAS